LADDQTFGWHKEGHTHTLPRTLSRLHFTDLDVPEHGSSQVDVVLEQSHARVPGPAGLVVVADDVLAVGVRVRQEESLHQVFALVARELEHHEELVGVAEVDPNRVAHLRRDVRERHVLVGKLMCERERETDSSDTEEQARESHVNKRTQAL